MMEKQIQAIWGFPSLPSNLTFTHIHIHIQVHIHTDRHVYMHIYTYVHIVKAYYVMT